VETGEDRMVLLFLSTPCSACKDRGRRRSSAPDEPGVHQPSDAQFATVGVPRGASALCSYWRCTGTLDGGPSAYTCRRRASARDISLDPMRCVGSPLPYALRIQTTVSIAQALLTADGGTNHRVCSRWLRATFVLGRLRAVGWRCAQPHAVLSAGSPGDPKTKDDAQHAHEIPSASARYEGIQGLTRLVETTRRVVSTWRLLPRRRTRLMFRRMPARAHIASSTGAKARKMRARTSAVGSTSGSRTVGSMKLRWCKTAFTGVGLVA